MSTVAQKKFFQSLGNFLRASAEALDELAGGEGEQVAEKPAPAPKKAPAPKPAPAAPAAAPAPTPAAAAQAVHAAAQAATPQVNGPTPTEPLMAQARAAAKAYAEVYGREGLKEVLQKFTTGTMADVEPAKLPELLKALS